MKRPKLPRPSSPPSISSGRTKRERVPTALHEEVEDPPVLQSAFDLQRQNAEGVRANGPA